MLAAAQTFRALTPKDALDAVKSTLGPDAVILSTREVPGAMGLRKQFEVVATLEAKSANSSFAPPPQPTWGKRRELSRLADRMQANGVEEQVIDSLLARARARRDRYPGNEDRDYMRSAALDIVGAPCRAPWLAPSAASGRRCVALVGPTGAGKTTTLAKIAAKAVIDEGLNVALINLDTFRIGAIDQLGRYAEILGVPMYVARDREEIARALGHASNADLVLIDTAGRSVLDEEATRRQATLLSNIPAVEMLLTVSAATGRVPLERVAARYQSMSPTGLVVTKLDEAGGMPSVLSVAWTVAWPVACVTAGQRVPEDIEELDHERLIQETFA